MEPVVPMTATDCVRRTTLTCLASALALACTVELCETVRGTGEQASRVKSVGSFDQLEVRGDLNVTVEVGGESLVTVEGYENLIPHVEAVVQGHRLIVRVRDACRLEPAPRILVLAPALTEFDLHGSGAIAIQRARGESLELGLYGGGVVVCDGKVSSVAVNISGSCAVDLFDLAASDVRVRLKGSGEVRTSVAEQLDVDVMGSGDVFYRGDPKLSKRTAGRGRVRRVD